MHLMTYPQTLTSTIKQMPCIEPQDSAGRVLHLLGDTDSPIVPVVSSNGKLLGVISQDDLLPLLKLQRDTHLTAMDLMHNPRAIAKPESSLDEIRVMLIESGELGAMVVDERNRYLGTVTLMDLLHPGNIPPRPSHPGGMATPGGVYLTNGAVQAGAGNGWLVASGAMIGFALALAHGSIGLTTLALEKFSRWPLYTLWTSSQPVRIEPGNIGWFALQSLSLLLFGLIMRMLPLAGYHAAEHQAVHAMERGEPLIPEVVRRQSRIHPRCGTNLLAGGLIFGVISQIVPLLGWGMDMSDGAVIGALAAFFGWRKFGAFIQQNFTTRPPTEKQLASGIQAAQDLELKYLQASPRKPHFLRRIWCMGMPQTILGATLSSGLAITFFEWLFRTLR